MKTSQAANIWTHLDKYKGVEVPAVDLHRIGSGKQNGFCASLSRRISDLRAMGYNITCRKETQKNGQIHSFYTMK